MTKKTLTKIAAVALWALPLTALAQATGLDLGIDYGSYTGLGSKDPRQTIAQIINIALSLLGITPILIILKQKPLAEQLAVYAYYLLLLAVLLNFSENLHNKKEKG